MIYIGIDIAKSSHFASAVNSDNEVIVNPFKFTNDDKGFNLFINTFKDFDLSNCLVGLESTGIYGDNLTTFLFSKGFRIGRINPIQTDSLRSSNIRKTKNDKIDTLLIAKCLMLGNYTLVTEKDIEIIKLKTLCRFKFDVTLMIAKGIQTQIISRKVGHSSVQTTDRVYSHFFEDEFKNVPNVMEEFLTVKAN